MKKTRQTIHPPKTAPNRRYTRIQLATAGREQNWRLTSLLHELPIDEEGEESSQDLVQVITPSRMEHQRHARKSKLPRLQGLGPQQRAGIGPAIEGASASELDLVGLELEKLIREIGHAEICVAEQDAEIS